MDEKKLELPEHVLKELRQLYVSYARKLSERLEALQIEFTNDLAKKLMALSNSNNLGMSLSFHAEEVEEYIDDYQATGDIRGLAELFTNNTIAEWAIDNDPSGDWDGINRIQSFEEHTFPLSFLGSNDAEDNEDD